jgi:hypothetical protein
MEELYAAYRAQQTRGSMPVGGTAAEELTPNAAGKKEGKRQNAETGQDETVKKAKRSNKDEAAAKKDEEERARCKKERDAHNRQVAKGREQEKAAEKQKQKERQAAEAAKKKEEAAKKKEEAAKKKEQAEALSKELEPVADMLKDDALFTEAAGTNLKAYKKIAKAQAAKTRTTDSEEPSAAALALHGRVYMWGFDSGDDYWFVVVGTAMPPSASALPERVHIYWLKQLGRGDTSYFVIDPAYKAMVAEPQSLSDSQHVTVAKLVGGDAGVWHIPGWLNMDLGVAC